MNEDKEIFEPTAPKARTDSYHFILQADEKSKMLKDQIPSIKPFEHSMELQKSVGAPPSTTNLKYVY